MKHGETVDARLVALGAAVRKARTSQGIIQAKLARMTGQSNGQSYIYRIESGSPVSVTVLAEIADALDVRADDLVDF